MKPLVFFLILSLGAGFVLLLSLDDAGENRPPQLHTQPARTVERPADSRPMTAPRREPALAAHVEPERPLERQAADALSERRTQLQAQFAAQPIDPSWASSSKQLLNDDLGKYASADVRVRGVECRSTLCRVELAPVNRDAGQRFMEAWVRHRTWTGPGFAASDGDSMIVFLGRPGGAELALAN